MTTRDVMAKAMTGPIRFRVYGDPATQGSKRAFIPKGHTRAVIVDDNKPKLRNWRGDVRDAASAAYDGSLLTGPLRLDMTFYLPRPKSQTKAEQSNWWHYKKPDTSKLVRAVEDALKLVLWQDDAQVAELSASKIYAGETQRPGVKVEVYVLKGEA